MNAVLERLRAELPPEILRTGEEIPEKHWSDWRRVHPARPRALVRPRTTAEVAATLRICHALAVPIVPQGGLTGLCGGAEPTGDAVALSLERLAGVEEVDGVNGTLTVRAGTPLAQVQDAADAQGFLCPLDLGARGTCAIGGNLSTNAGGNRVIRYGMAREMVLGLEVVLADGTVLDAMNRLVKNNTGYDLKQLFIGAEGTLGIITRAVLRIWPKPRCTGVAFCGLADFDAVIRLLHEARAGLGGTLSAFEVMWPSFYDLVTARASNVHAPLAGKHARYVLLESQGSDEAYDIPRFEAFLARMYEAGVIADAAVAQSEADGRAFWAIRDAVAEWRHMLGEHFGFDVGLPAGETDEFVDELEPAIRAAYPTATTVCFGHLGDGNLHVEVHVAGVETQPKEAVERITYDIVRRRGGTISAEHGIGTTKRAYLGYTRTPDEIALMRTLKQALDPKGILNPGKVI